MSPVEQSAITIPHQYLLKGNWSCTIPFPWSPIFAGKRRRKHRQRRQQMEKRSITHQSCQFLMQSFETLQTPQSWKMHPFSRVFCADNDEEDIEAVMDHESQTTTITMFGQCWFSEVSSWWLFTNTWTVFAIIIIQYNKEIINSKMLRAQGVRSCCQWIWF